MTRRAVRAGAATVAVGAWLALAGVAVAADGAVGTYDFAFRPSEVTIEAGDSVTWTNGDGVNHTATGSGWATGTIGRGATATVVFEEAGTYPYACRFHPAMQGTVVVLEVAGGAGDGADDNGNGASAPATDAAPAAAAAPDDPAGLPGIVALLVLAAVAGAGGWFLRPVPARARRR